MSARSRSTRSVESGGSGSVDWHFTVDNADIQFLAQGKTLTQVYTVTIAGDEGGSVQQDIAIAITGSNDTPTAVADTIITDVDSAAPCLCPDGRSAGTTTTRT